MDVKYSIYSSGRAFCIIKYGQGDIGSVIGECRSSIIYRSFMEYVCIVDDDGVRSVVVCVEGVV